mgnify:CR=1 FL=1
MIEQSSVAELVRTETPEMALQEISAALPCLLIVSILDNQEVASHIQFFKRLEASVRQYGLKVCVVTPLRNPQLAELATKKLGISEFIIEPIPARNFYFKLNMMLRSIDNFRRQQDARKVTENKMVVKKLATSDRPASAAARRKSRSSARRCSA